VGLPKKHRLKNWRNFKAVYEKGRFYRGTNLNLKALFVSKMRGMDLPRELLNVSPINLPTTCLGIAISKKVSKKAVVRNYIKRLIKACFRELLPLINPGWQLIILVRPTAIECQDENFLQELKQLFIKAGIMQSLNS
jgi:ribonuclease P protein component